MTFPTGWTRRARLSVPAAKLSETLTDFPLLLSEANIPAGFLTPGHVDAAQADGGDIRFSADAAGLQPLACELLAWQPDAVTPKALIWVKLPGLSALSDTAFYIWAQGGGAEIQPGPGDPYGRQAVWSDYAAVFHGGGLSDAAGGGVLYAIGAASAGNSGAPFGDYFTVGDAGGLKSDTLGGGFGASDILVISCWFRRGADNGDSQTNFWESILDWRNAAEDDGVALYMGAKSALDNKLFAATFGANTQNATAGQTCALGTWHLAHLVFDQATHQVSLYRNGAPDSVTSGYGDNSSVANVLYVGIRGSDWQGGIIGDIGECRMAGGRAHFTPGWIAAEYSNQSDPASFTAVDAPVSVAGGAVFSDMLALQSMAAAAGRDDLAVANLLLAGSLQGFSTAGQAMSQDLGSAQAISSFDMTDVMAAQALAADHLLAPPFLADRLAAGDMSLSATIESFGAAAFSGGGFAALWVAHALDPFSAPLAGPPAWRRDRAAIGPRIGSIGARPSIGRTSI